MSENSLTWHFPLELVNHKHVTITKLGLLKYIQEMLTIPGVNSIQLDAGYKYL